MRDTQLYQQILGLSEPWTVTSVELDRSAGNVVVKVEPRPDAVLSCPTCGTPAPRYDSRVRRWRHLDTCQYTTILEASVPRLSCPEHGVVTVAVPWAEPGSGFTGMFEALVIDWLHEASIQAVARQLRVSWSSIDRIMARAVARGMARRTAVNAQRLCVDETSFQKRHEYVTVVTDPDAGHVLHVADDRRTESLEEFYVGLDAAQKAAIRGVSMDMWPAFITATRRHIPDADTNSNPYRFVDPDGRLAEDEIRTGSNISGGGAGNNVVIIGGSGGAPPSPSPSSGSVMTGGSDAPPPAASDSGSGDSEGERQSEEVRPLLGCNATGTCIPLDQVSRGDKEFMMLVAAGPTAAALVVTRGAGAQYLVSTPKGRAMLFAACQAIGSCQGGKMEAKWVRQQRRETEARLEQSRRDGLIDAQRINTELVEP